MKLPLILFLEGPWDGEVRRMASMPTVFVKSGGEYRLQEMPEDLKEIKWREPVEHAYQWYKERTSARSLG